MNLCRFLRLETKATRSALVFKAMIEHQKYPTLLWE